MQIYIYVYTHEGDFKRLVCVCLKLLNKVVHDHGEHMYLLLFIAISLGKAQCVAQNI